MPTGQAAQQDVWRRAHGQPHLGRAARCQIVSNVHSRRARADHQDPLPDVGHRIAVCRRVQQFAGEGVQAGPSRNNGCVRPTGPDHHMTRRDVPTGRLQLPATIGQRFDTLHPCVQPMRRCHRYARAARGSPPPVSRVGKDGVPFRIRSARQTRNPLVCVELQPVVAAAPGCRPPAPPGR